MSDVDLVLVERLKEYLDPWRHFECRPEHVDSYPPVKEFGTVRFQRDRIYDMGRIRYFRDLFASGHDEEPILLDCLCNSGHVYPVPVIIDGWHRFAAADAAERRQIQASFSGRVDLLRYLVGKTDAQPSY